MEMAERAWVSVLKLVENTAREALRNRWIPILLADSCFFAFCCLIYKCQQHLRRRRRRRAAQTASNERLEEALLPEDDQGRRLTATSSNYVAFLDTSRRLFIVLAVLSVVATSAVWGPSVVVNGDDVRNIARTLFDTERDCQRGFPQGKPSQVTDCMMYNVTGRWAIHVPQVGDPRPAGSYMWATSLDDCENCALLCGALALAFSRKHEQCWLFASLGDGNMSMFGDWRSCEGHQDFIPGVFEFALTILYGLITLFFACRLISRLSQSEKSLLETCAIWLTELPCEDKEDGQPFELEDEDFSRVAQDLKNAINDQLGKRLREEHIGSPFAEEEKVLAVCVVHARRGRSSSSKRRLAGHAFAIMSREAYAAALLTPGEHACGLKCLQWLPWYVRWHAHTLFKFGVAPWSAVTLRLQTARPASDIIWNNLHVKKYRTFLGRAILEVLLFIISLSLVAPVSLANAFYQLVDNLHQEDMQESWRPLPSKFWSLLGDAAENLPSYVLLLLNSVVLPLLIQQLNDRSRPHLRSESESNQFRTNLLYLLINSFLVPLLGLLTTEKTRWEQIVAYFTRLREGHTDMLRAVAMRSRQPPSELMLKYMANAALVSSACQLIQLGKGIGRRCLCLPDEPWPFAWGYWYAWSMSAFVVSLTLGVVMPTQLLLAVLFFTLTQRVHQENLEQNVFITKFDMDRDAEVSIVSTMVIAVGIFWAFMAFFFYSQPRGHAPVVTLWVPYAIREGPEADIMPFPGASLWVPVRWLAFFSMIIFASGVWLASWLFEQKIWRRLGEQGVPMVTCSVQLLAVLIFLTGVLTCSPHFRWESMEVTLQVLAAYVLVFLAILVWMAASVIRWLAKRRARGRYVRSLRALLDGDGGGETDFERLKREDGMEGMEGLVSRGGFTRMDSVEMEG